MKRLIKTIEGAECEIFVVKNHRRLFVGKAVPTIEIYQNVTDVSILGKTKSQSKTYEFSLIVCSDPELDKTMESGVLDGLSHFDLATVIKRKDGVFAPFDFHGLTDFSIEAFDRWIFNVNDYEVTKTLLEF
jgi:hypothetical protein